jgi:hypothetical protein
MKCAETPEVADEVSEGKVHYKGNIAVEITCDVAPFFMYFFMSKADRIDSETMKARKDEEHEPFEAVLKELAI